VTSPLGQQGAQILTRVQEAQQAAAQEAADAARRAQAAQAAQQLNGFISAADSALAGQKYDEAIAAYDKALGSILEQPRHQRQELGRAGACAGPDHHRRGRGRGWDACGRKGLRVRQDGGRQHRDEAGRIGAGRLREHSRRGREEGLDGGGPARQDQLRHRSRQPKAGERYTVKVFLVNEGNAPIQLRDMVVSTAINGKKISAPVPPQAVTWRRSRRRWS